MHYTKLTALQALLVPYNIKKFGFYKKVVEVINV